RDFQYKGIFKLFTSISEWTDRYLANKILPNEDQLAREVGLEREKVELFIKELCFKGSAPLVKKITSVEFDPANASRTEMISNVLRRNTVFARPPSLDANSSQRYVNNCNETSIAAIKKALASNRVKWAGDKFKEFIFEKVNANKLSDTYASADIANLFNCPYDTTKALKESTVNTHLKPILKKLVDDKILLFFRNEQATKSSNKSIFLYNDKEEIYERIAVYLAYLKKYIVPSFQKIGVLGEVTEEEYKNYTKLANTIIRYMDNTYGDQKFLVEELIILGNFYDSYKEELSKKEQKERIQEILKLLESAGRITELNGIRIKGEPIPREVVPQLISNDNIYYTEYNDGHEMYEFILHKNCVTSAIEHAKKIYESTDNDVDLRILSRMNIHSSLDAEKKKEFYSAEMASLFRYLPFFTRMWRMIMGNIYVTKEEADMIRAQKELEQKKRIEESKAKAIAKEKAKLVEERMKQPDKKEIGQDTSTNKVDTELQMAALEEERQLKEFLKNIIRVLDKAWDEGIQPDREYLFKEVSDTGMTEEELINYLKKNFSKDIYSFQIKSKKKEGSSKYKWPILISKNYIKRNGRRLLNLAIKESDAERQGAAPDQDRFDFYSSLESFLEKVLAKKPT
ncbi:MAG: hypothetical protein KDK36_21175, partial [Leptospiraceae bacterium]|nr:hypothetical protein [Leptospiraceae bacterium]